MSRPRAIVLRAEGTNCDAEMIRAFTLAGADAELLHVDRAIKDPASLDQADLLGFPGGFSYGDDIASGRIFAMRLREHLYPALAAAARRGCLMIGACNGFQILVQAGLLPGPRAGEPWPDTAPPQRVALSDNVSARFSDRWVGMTVEPSTVCLWTRGLTDSWPGSEASDVLTLPVAHGEGRFVADSVSTITELERAGQIALRYADNYNGSEGAIAGICDPTGRIFGLMPHPERYLDWNRHPYWTRLPASLRTGATPGLRIFQNAVEAVQLTPR